MEPPKNDWFIVKKQKSIIHGGGRIKNLDIWLLNTKNNANIDIAVFGLCYCLFCGDSTILYKFKNCYLYFKVVVNLL